ncbi:CpsB/CapC family capsule biosynthesis tyrosine phosphatase [Limibacter armeniacum]|uniref:tyrosine-protein phosphatase n=1 Tax=Limibacter armeniacum TaxID=466084 RepID=UPI002FE5EDAC
MLFSFFKKKSKKEPKVYENITPLTVDVHSHLLPGIDDGAETIEDSLEMLSKFAQYGYRKMILTPHIMMDFYQNTPEIIMKQLDLLREAALKKGIDIELEAAAEYYLDEGLIEKLENEEPLLTFGNRYLLFEMSYMNPSKWLDKAVFMMQSQGYKPVLAHPERYTYLSRNYSELLELKEKGVHLQVNTLSLMGYYSKVSQNIAEKLIDDRVVSFIGSDCHKLKHADRLQEAQALRYYNKALSLNLLNNSL